MASQDWFEKDFYKTLGVPQDASEADIKKAYHKLARKYHPDRNPGDTTAETKFKEVGEAHDVLANKEKRQEYDAMRAMAGGGARFTAGGGGGHAGGFEDIFSSFGGGRQQYGGGGPSNEDLEDILRMFGGAGGMGGASRGRSSGGYGGMPFDFSGFGATQGPRPGADIEASTTIDFRSAVLGSQVTLSKPDGGTITVRIPAGVKDGQRIKLRGKGNPGDPGAPNGDMILTVTVTPDDLFGRDGDNLTLDVPITFAEAVLGATITIPTLSGDKVRVRVAPGTPSGRVLRVKGRGVEPKGRKAGDLLAKLHVLVPTDLPEDAKQEVRDLAERFGPKHPRADLMARAGQ